MSLMVHGPTVLTLFSFSRDPKSLSIFGIYMARAPRPCWFLRRKAMGDAPMPQKFPSSEGSASRAIQGKALPVGLQLNGLRATALFVSDELRGHTAVCPYLTARGPAGWPGCIGISPNCCSYRRMS
jgi:hypothetical protein